MVKTVKNHNTKKTELVEIAEELFLKKGYEETSINDILEASGLSKGGFYHYFKSKDEVLGESIINFAEGLLKEADSIINNPELSALQKLNEFMKKKVALQKQNKEILNYIFMLMKSDFTLYKYCMVIAQKYVDPLSQIIDQGVKEGVFNVEHPIETADILLRAITSVPQSIFFSEYTKDRNKSLKYKSSLETVVSRTLGVESKELKIF